MFCSHTKSLQKLQLMRKYSRLSYIHQIGQRPLRSLTVGKLLKTTVEKFGDITAIISRHQNKAITYYKLLQDTDKLAAGFLALGLQKGDRLGIWAPNLYEWYLTKMACARIGVILVAINSHLQPLELEYCINKVGIKGLVMGETLKKQNYYEKIIEISPELSKCDPGKLKSAKMPSLKTIIAISDNPQNGTYLFGEVQDLGNASSLSSIDKNQDCIQPDDPCNIQFTSGTTGKPKAAVTSHFNLVNNGFFLGERNELGMKQHKICVQVPFFHAFGTAITIMGSLNYGSTLVLPSAEYSPKRSLDAIKAEQCTIIHGTPTMYVDLIHIQTERNEQIAPEIAVSGGALCSPHLFKQMLSVLKVRKVKSVYGLTETTAVVFQSLFDDDQIKSTTTVGHIGDHIEAKVVDTNNRMVPFGTPGELCVRGYTNMLGYWEEEQKTKEMIGHDKWLKTGDQFILEENGYGKVVGRLKDMIIRGGENIFPKEIEDFLNTHPKILETHVVGLPHERLGEEICACIRVTDSHLTLEEIHNFCKGKMADFKIPTKLKIVEQFPKTASGKVQKFKLKSV